MGGGSIMSPLTVLMQDPCPLPEILTVAHIPKPCEQWPYSIGELPKSTGT